MKKVLLYLLIVAFIAVILPDNSVFADSVTDKILVGLKYGSTAVSSAVVSANGYYIKSASDEPFYETVNQAQLTVKPNASGGVDVYQDGSCIITYAYDVVIYPMLGNIVYDGKVYRGALQFGQSGGAVNVINRLETDEYLYGVVPNEIGGNSPAEALKAQAVCARNYAVKNRGRHSSQGFDLCASQHCQVYRDMSCETTAVCKAVDETSGIVARYGNDIAELFYFSSDGGYTESVANVWGSSGYPYLTGVADPYETDKATHHTWSVTFTKSDLSSLFGSAVGSVSDMNILSTSENGAVTKLEIVGTSGTKIYEREQCRTAFGGKLFSQAYTITKNYADGTSVVLGIDENEVKNMADVVYVIDGNGEITQQSIFAMEVLTADGLQQVSKPVGDITSFTLNGRGYGHLIGMSQWGAISMAELGFTYDEILKLYFTGISLGQ